MNLTWLRRPSAAYAEPDVTGTPGGPLLSCRGVDVAYDKVQVLFEGIVLFGPEMWQGLGQGFADAVPLLLTGPLLIANLYNSPGGLAGDAFDARDRFLRRIAEKRGIHVPSLVADRRVEDDEGHGHTLSAEPDASLEQAAAHGHEVLEERPDALACPVCDEPLTIETFSTHEHLRARSRSGGLR